MSKRRATREDRCERCKINYRLCFCEAIKPVDIKTPVQIIMHYRESFLTSNTANLLNLMHEGCHIHLRGLMDKPLNFEQILNEENTTPLLLFPDENAVELTPAYIQSLDKPINLIVPDGTWSQAKKVKKRENALSNIQTITLPTGDPSRYKLRTAPKPGQVSTFEAMARALGIIEGKALQEQLESVFELMVERVLMSRRGGYENTITPRVNED